MSLLKFAPCQHTSPYLPSGVIEIWGAREHNLQDVNLTLPKGRLVVFTGVSGSGKSSLAFDTLYAEGQRRYVESLSAYARQFLGQMKKPEVDRVEGLSPALAIQQKSVVHNPRSTVATITEVHDYLRVLFARAGTLHCPGCGRPVEVQGREGMLATVCGLPAGTKVSLLAPVVRQQRGEYRDLLDELARRGFMRALVDGQLRHLKDRASFSLAPKLKHDIEVLLDRVTIRTDGAAAQETRERVSDALEQGLHLMQLTQGSRLLRVLVETPSDPRREMMLSSEFACPKCGLSFEPPEPAWFSFNSPQGMCEACLGLGVKLDFDPALCLVDQDQSVLEGAVGPFRGGRPGKWVAHLLAGVAKALDFDLRTPWRDLAPAHRRALFYGTGQRPLSFEYPHSRGEIWKHGGTWSGLLSLFAERYQRARSGAIRKFYERFMRRAVCRVCGGARLNEPARAVRLGDKNLPEVLALTVAEAAQFFGELRLAGPAALIAEEPLKEIRTRLEFLSDVGLHYLTLDRPAPTLAGGEIQRLRLARCLGAGLVGVLYVLDEPSVGLHPRDNRRLLDSLEKLCRAGNTAIVVEHDEETMRRADYLVDFGPGPGHLGGRIVAAGQWEDLLASKESLTGAYLRGERLVPSPPAEARLQPGQNPRSPAGATWLTVHGARQHNLKNLTVRFPLGLFTVVTGVSGSGKSSLVEDILHRALARELHGAQTQPGEHDRLSGQEHLDKVIDLDQSPIGRTPRSNPATYTKVFDHIRALFARLPESRRRGYLPGRFSFNVKGGRCEACEGHGAHRVEMDFLADVWVTCPVCEGRRFNHETLQVRYKGKNIAEVLAMEVDEALTFFAPLPPIAAILRTLAEVGLGYVKLGQPAPTLSGGEAQRIKLAQQLARRATGRTLYLLDEPTTGLHFADVEKLLAVLRRLVSLGNTVVVVEHNLEVSKAADWLIDLGPEGGAEGGRIVAEGPPEAIAAAPLSHTGAALKPVLERVARLRAGKRTAPHRPPRRRQAPPAESPLPNTLTLTGACQHNLKNLTVKIPRGQTTVVSGVSGSGKSSLAFDTLYAEGRRRYVESLSPYARQFLGQLDKPKVESVSGLSPAIALERQSAAKSPRSTVGTVTEVYDYLRLLWARAGVPYCPSCGGEVGALSADEIVERLLAEVEEDAPAFILAPLAARGNEELAEVVFRAAREGFSRARIDGMVVELSNEAEVRRLLDRRQRHEAEVVVDRLKVSRRARSRLAEAVEAATSLSGGSLVVRLAQELPGVGNRTWVPADAPGQRFSQRFSCRQCGANYEELTPHHFSFNSPLGWCPVCQGLGTQTGANLADLIPYPEKSLAQGAVANWPRIKDSLLERILAAVAAASGFSLKTPFAQLSPEHRRLVLYGAGERWFSLPAGSGPALSVQWLGLYPAVDRAAKVSWRYRRELSELLTEVLCPACRGGRLRPEAAAVKLEGKSIVEVCSMSLGRLQEWLAGLRLGERESRIAGEVREEIRRRLRFLIEVGLEYLTLGRAAPTLSGGEAQRLQLAGQIGSGLSGVLYVLDEPTIGLHPVDTGKLLGALRRLRDLDNTLVVVEHDREVIAAADHLLDLGPGAGKNGGRLVAQGAPSQVVAQNTGLTADYLAGRKAIPVPASRRPGKGQVLTVHGARHHNLKDLTVTFPLGTLIAVTGVSGSGKSSLVFEVLGRALARRLYHARVTPGEHRALQGLEHLDKLIVVDHAPLGATPMSNPATYVGLFDQVRHLYAQLPAAKVRGFHPDRFSFLKPAGRCEACWGHGYRRIEMHFLPDVWVECPSCRGSRYHAESLSVKFKGATIADVLNMSAREALEHFWPFPALRRPLQTLVEVGLDYLPLGQAAPTLSTGEAQRVKLAAELSRPSTGRTLYLLDEPTTGLHFEDVRQLLEVLHRLVDLGNTVLVVEHNLEVIKSADYVVDLGPGPGEDGGRIVAAGSPEEIAAHPASATGSALRPVLQQSPRREREHGSGSLGARTLDPGGYARRPF